MVRSSLMILLGFVIVLISVATTFAQVRYRAPAEVAFVLAAAFAVDAIVVRVRRPKVEAV